MQKRFILASASPRRKELLGLLGLPFEIIPGEIDEWSYFTGKLDDPPHMVVEELALEKARDVFYQIAYGQVRSETADHIILAADTIVLSDRSGHQRILGKPEGEEDARRMLLTLSGTTHTVLTGVCLMESQWIEEHDEWWPFWNTRVVHTQVKFRELSNEMIDAYLATGEPFDKAGAYGIQGFASSFVEGVYGDYFNVVGLPIQTVTKMLENIGIDWWRGKAALDIS